MDHLELEGSVTAYAVPVDTHRRRGCPQLEISRDQLEYLVSLSFNWTQIAAILGVSRMTVYRRRREFGMLDEPRTNINDGHTLSQDPIPCGTLVHLLAISPIMILDIACVECYRHTRNVHKLQLP